MLLELLADCSDDAVAPCQIHQSFGISPCRCSTLQSSPPMPYICKSIPASVHTHPCTSIRPGILQQKKRWGRQEACPIFRELGEMTLAHFANACQFTKTPFSVAERLTNASAWYSWHREEVTHGYHQAMGARWRRRASGDRVGRTRPSRYSQRRVDGRI